MLRDMRHYLLPSLPRSIELRLAEGTLPSLPPSLPPSFTPSLPSFLLPSCPSLPSRACSPHGMCNV
jgi:hypothetical protein